MRKVLLDFDGTLAFRPGNWSQCLVDVLDDVAPGHGLSADDVRPFVRGRFPWHEPERAHSELSVPDLWWRNLDPLFGQALRAVGIDERVHEAVVRGVRPHYCDHTRFHLYPETIGALQTLRDADWSTVIVSNHVPELPTIVSRMGLDGVIDQVFTSALTGYEKPNPEAFRIALGGADPEACFMVGDNPVADVLGAEQVGIRGILVRGEASSGRPSAPDLMAAAAVILDTP